MWSERKFRKEFRNVKTLQSVFPKISITTVLVTMTLNTLEYIRKTLNFKMLVHFYRKPLDRLNITYTVAPITSSGFKDINFLIPPKISSIVNIEKIMIFVISIEKCKALEIYLQTLLPDKLKDRGEDTIKSFSSILEATSKTEWLEKFLNDDTRIIICKDAGEMVVDILDIRRVIQ